MLARPAVQLFPRLSLHCHSEEFAIYCFLVEHILQFFVRKSSWKVKFCETLFSENSFIVLYNFSEGMVGFEILG